MATQYEIQWAKQILKQEEEKVAFITNQYLRLVVLLATTKREGALTLKMREEEPGVEFADGRTNFFNIYYFNKMEDIKAGFKLIEKAIKTGEVIPYYSSGDISRDKTKATF